MENAAWSGIDVAVREQLETILLDVLTPRGLKQWLQARHRLLGGKTAREVLLSGDTASVIDAARAYAEAVYL